MIYSRNVIVYISMELQSLPLAIHTETVVWSPYKPLKL